MGDILGSGHNRKKPEISNNKPNSTVLINYLFKKENKHILIVVFAMVLVLPKPPWFNNRLAKFSNT